MPDISIFSINIVNILILYSYLIVLSFEILSVTEYIFAVSGFTHGTVFCFVFFDHFYYSSFLFTEFILMKYLRPELKVSFSHRSMYANSRLEVLWSQTFKPTRVGL